MKTILLSALLLATSAWAYKVTGVLAGKQEVLIKSKSQGEITQIEKKEGTKVLAGDTLATIDDEQEQIEWKQAAEELKSAKGDYLKTKALKKYVSQEELIKKRDIYLKKKSIYELKGYNLKNTKITSPIAGVISKKFIKMGETVSNGAKTFEVINSENLIIEIDVLAEKSKNLKIGRFLSFSSDLHPKKSFKAKITFVAPTIDKASGTTRLKLELKNNVVHGRYELKPGTLVNVHLKTDRLPASSASSK
ncbi:MAG: efflux RND transporter periplasmic adaptor subunit [Bacteriovoracaceae bacterium]|jgi:membrane fusion protein, multidrug efflux system|nr:efflux RND transporter periplasmic adaptor subunit [Bacteriovoracaceae bacterium]